MQPRQRLPVAAALAHPEPAGIPAATVPRIPMTLADVSLLLIVSGLFAVLARLDPTD